MESNSNNKCEKEDLLVLKTESLDRNHQKNISTNTTAQKSTQLKRHTLYNRSMHSQNTECINQTQSGDKHFYIIEATKLDKNVFLKDS